MSKAHMSAGRRTCLAAVSAALLIPAAFGAWLLARETGSGADKAEGANRLVEAKDRLMSMYDPDRGQWNGAEWWHQPVALETLINMAGKVPAERRDVQALAAQVFEKNGRDRFINDYFDDSSWWALCWLSAYELTGEKRYLEAARTIFKHLTGKGWDTGTCGGGMVWHTSNRYKNAITNEQFIRIALWLYRLSLRDGNPQREYLDWGEKAWAWFSGSGMQNEQGLINDGLDNCRNNGQNPWTYNQGVIVGALADLYLIKGDKTYLDKAYRIAEANISYNSAGNGVLMEKGCGDGNCGNDGAIFKGIFIRNLEHLLKVSPSDRPEKKSLEEFLSRNAEAAWANRLDDGLFGVRWDRKLAAGKPTAAQCAGLDVLVAASDGGGQASPKVCLYDKADYGGAVSCHQVPSEIWMLPDAFQDKVSSIRVSPGACLTVYADYGYKGESRDITSSTSWIGPQWNDRITSFKAYPCPAK
ncbi:MAG TPA: glycoside hydrolase family 76 protein [Elusimicrobiales bacterium]|nr:glycoside hydrolase family 76 protein [Elusimicrobiales bacterium]